MAPPRSEAQRRLMHAAARDAEVAKAADVPQGVAEKYARTDPGGALPKRKKRRHPSQFGLPRTR